MLGTYRHFALVVEGRRWLQHHQKCPLTEPIELLQPGLSFLRPCLQKNRPDRLGICLVEEMRLFAAACRLEVRLGSLKSKEHSVNYIGIPNMKLYTPYLSDIGLSGSQVPALPPVALPEKPNNRSAPLL